MGTDHFPWALKFTLEQEGGDSDDPRDPGGRTRYGISQRAFPDEDIESLTPTRAASIYKRYYWDACRCSALPPAWALAVFDAAVNMGPSVAIKMAQEACGVARDGIMGEETIEACYRASTEQLQRTLVLRLRRYVSMGGFDVYGNGWMKRVVALAMEIGGLV